MQQVEAVPNSDSTDNDVDGVPVAVGHPFLPSMLTCSSLEEDYGEVLIPISH